MEDAKGSQRPGAASAILLVAIAMLASIVIYARWGAEVVVPAVRSIVDANANGNANNGGDVLDGFVMVAAVAIAISMSIAWLFVRGGRERPLPLLLLAVAISLITWIVGAHRLSTATAAASLAHAPFENPVRLSIGELTYALGCGTHVWLMGTLLASTVFIFVSLLFAFRARAWVGDATRATGATRGTTLHLRGILSFVIGAATIAGLVYAHGSVGRVLNLGPYLREHAFLALIPSAFGVVAITLGAHARSRSGAGGGDPPREVVRDVVLSGTASCIAVLLIAPACAFSGPWVLIASADDALTRQAVSEITYTSSTLPVFVLPALLPVVLAALVAVGSRPTSSLLRLERSELAALTTILIPSALSFLILFGAYGRMRRVSGEMLSTPSRPPAVGDADSCKDLPRSRVLLVNASGVVAQNLHAPFPADGGGGCEDVVSAIDSVSKTDDLWMSIDPSTPFSRVGCLLDELAERRGARAGFGPVTRASSEKGSARSWATPAPGCSLYLVGVSEFGHPICRRTLLADPRCFETHDSATHVMELRLLPSGKRQIWQRWRSGVLSTRDLAPDENIMAPAQPIYFSMARDLTLVIIQGNRETSFADVLLLASSYDKKRKISGQPPFQSEQANVLALASSQFAPSVDDSILPSFDVMPPPTSTTDLRENHRSTLWSVGKLCALSGCSRHTRAKLIIAWALLGKRVEVVLAFAQARALDPDIELPTLTVNMFGDDVEDKKNVLKSQYDRDWELDRENASRTRVAPAVNVTIVASSPRLDDVVQAQLKKELESELLHCALFYRNFNRSNDLLDPPEDDDVSFELTPRGRVMRARLRSNREDECIPRAFNEARIPPPTRENAVFELKAHVKLTHSKY